jgi:hypothetical protein
LIANDKLYAGHADATGEISAFKGKNRIFSSWDLNFSRFFSPLKPLSRL